MTLSQRHRSSIYRTLSDVLGQEEAEAMLAEFPANEGSELVTKDFLRAELAEFRTELRNEIAALRVELHSGLRQQLIWMIATIFVAITVSTTLSALLT